MFSCCNIVFALFVCAVFVFNYPVTIISPVAVKCQSLL